jgi:hypothetical protein
MAVGRAVGEAVRGPAGLLAGPIHQYASGSAIVKDCHSCDLESQTQGISEKTSLEQ